MFIHHSLGEKELCVATKVGRTRILVNSYTAIRILSEKREAKSVFRTGEIILSKHEKKRTIEIR